MNIEIFKDGHSTGTIMPASNKVMLKTIIDFNQQQATHYEQKLPSLRGYILEPGVASLGGFNVSQTEERLLRWKCSRPLKEFLEIN